MDYQDPFILDIGIGIVVVASGELLLNLSTLHNGQSIYQGIFQIATTKTQIRRNFQKAPIRFVSPFEMRLREWNLIFIIIS